MQIIPFKEPASWKMQINLTNQIFNLSFKWNAMNGYWVMSISDRNDNPIIYGIKVVTNYDLTAQFVVSGMPLGDIVCQNIISEWIDITRFAMGVTDELIYYEPHELETESELELVLRRAGEA